MSVPSIKKSARRRLAGISPAALDDAEISGLQDQSPSELDTTDDKPKRKPRTCAICGSNTCKGRMIRALCTEWCGKRMAALRMVKKGKTCDVCGSGTCKGRVKRTLCEELQDGKLTVPATRRVKKKGAGEGVGEVETSPSPIRKSPRRRSEGIPSATVTAEGRGEAKAVAEVETSPSKNKKSLRRQSDAISSAKSDAEKKGGPGLVVEIPATPKRRLMRDGKVGRASNGSVDVQPHRRAPRHPTTPTPTNLPCRATPRSSTASPSPRRSSTGNCITFTPTSSDFTTHLQTIATTVWSSRNLLIGIGAGVSTAAGISDFRSSEGYYHTATGKEVKKGLDANGFFDHPEEAARAIYKVGGMHAKAVGGEKSTTAFHEMVRYLEGEGHLLRLYSQNIDNLDQLLGLGDRLVKMHGDLYHLRCPKCSLETPLPCAYEKFWAQDFDKGPLPFCTSCAKFEEARTEAGKRSCGRVPVLLPAIVRYGEEHWNGMFR
ncbi:DHS-like NAD/FAD-binding domain-containing protein [Fimicolochytrium jonesii]|uniref:DHS-like NAD/FAD-binding domain-containing protein n=1 Tax=Fimicolochytrium jonesii TaxID=1396493 RepID=UPI0022FEFF0D|nr:DHS-like NAD/FAD-binding domain-containing protein [Fimicolochytrium jonesii]KAI8823153.1 DHS-like NAD/FAD-binding domain-containing protein [Fimicolochytrium jonesii]